MAFEPRKLVLPAAAVVLLATACGWMLAWSPGLVTFAPVVGLAAGLASRRPAIASAVAGLGGLAGLSIAAAPAFSPGVSPFAHPSQALASAVGAAVVAAGAAWALDRAPRWRGAAAGLAVAFVVLACWYAALAAATAPTFSDGTSVVQALSNVPKPGPDTADEMLYLNVVDRMHRGGAYYATYVDVLGQAQAAPQLVASPTAVRLPTLYLALSLLPPGGIWLVVTMLVGATAAIVSAYALARCFVVRPLALSASALVASYYFTEAASFGMLGTEIWAGTLGLVAVTLIACAARTPAHRTSLTWAAAGAALAATAVRELAVAFLLVGLVASLLDRRREPRAWIPWTGGLAAAALGYAAHWRTSRAAVAASHLAERVTAAAHLTWLRPDGLGLVAAVDRLERFVGLAPAGAWALAALAVAGAFLAPQDRTMRAVLGACTLGGFAALAILRPPGYAETGLPPSYWADVVLPVALACVPLAFARIAGAARATVPSTSPEPTSLP
jgi:hypothetical protein